MSVRNQVKPTKWGFCSCVAWQGKGGREISPNINVRNHLVKLNLQTSLRTFRNPSTSSLLFVPNSFVL